MSDLASNEHMATTDIFAQEGEVIVQMGEAAYLRLTPMTAVAFAQRLLRAAGEATA